MLRADNESGDGQGSVSQVGACAGGQRPAEAEGRAVPGQWEGNLIRGSLSSTIATLLERSSRFLQLI